jgi:enoyl-CoA hydratase/carnithine racemase
MRPEVNIRQEIADVTLFAKVAAALRSLEDDAGVRQVIVSTSRGEVVVVGSDYSHVALRAVA